MTNKKTESTPNFFGLEVIDDVTEMMVGYRGFTKSNIKCPDCGSYNYEDGYCNECEGDGN